MCHVYTVYFRTELPHTPSVPITADLYHCYLVYLGLRTELPHTLSLPIIADSFHRYLVSPVWTNVCFVRVDLNLNDFPQVSHLFGLVP